MPLHAYFRSSFSALFPVGNGRVGCSRRIAQGGGNSPEIRFPRVFCLVCEASQVVEQPQQRRSPGTRVEIMFAPDDLVVYPAQGGQNRAHRPPEYRRHRVRIYIVRIRANNITLMVPVNNAANVGLRTLTPEADAQSILETLRGDTDKTIYTGQNWNRRFREYSERLKSPDLLLLRSPALLRSSAAARNSPSANAVCRNRPWAC